MKFSALVLVVVLGLFGLAFRSIPALRDTVRSARLTGERAERYKLYATGKTFVRINWPASGTAEFLAWGDDSGENAVHVNDTTDAAIGHFQVDAGGVKVRRPWCVAINRLNGDPIDFAVGEEAEKSLESITAGTFVTARTRNGSSLWRGNVLDEKAHR